MFLMLSVRVFIGLLGFDSKVYVIHIFQLCSKTTSTRTLKWKKRFVSNHMSTEPGCLGGKQMLQLNKIVNDSNN